MESKQLTSAFAASLIWLNITRIFHLPTKRVQLRITLKVDLAFFMNEENDWILNGAVILAYGTTQIQ